MGPRVVQDCSKNPVELGSVTYLNLSEDGKHGVYEYALEAIENAPSKPIFVNFVEWEGCAGSKDAGKIFADPSVKSAAEDYFTPVCFNTWDRYDKSRNQGFLEWSKGLESSDWGYLRIIDPRDKTTLLAGTKQITGYNFLNDVKEVMRTALKKMDISPPSYL